MNSKSMLRPVLTLALAAALWCVGGCRKAPPTQLTEAELPAAVEAAFAKSPPALRAQATAAVEAFQKQQLAVALAQFQALCAAPSITDAQRELASRALLTVNEKLQAASASGDAQADAMLQYRQQNK